MLRIGDGVTPLGTTATAGAIVEINPITGAIVQTINLPVLSANISGVYRGSCTFYGSDTTGMPYSLNANGQAVSIGCHDSGLGGLTYTGTWRTAASVNYLGQVDTSTVFSMGSSEYFRGIASADGSGFYLGGSVGIKYAALGSQRAVGTAQTSGTWNLRGMQVGADGALYVVTSTSPYGVAKAFSAPLPTTTQTVNLAPIAATAAAYSYVTGLWVDPVTSDIWTTNYCECH